MVSVRSGLAATTTTYEVGESSRVFKPGHARNWRGAKTEALLATIWYPVNADGKLYEEPQMIGPPDGPLFLAGGAAVNAPIATSQGKFPVVMLSHGTGGSALQLAWLGTVGINHPGNNALEPYTPEGFVLWWERATDISDALDALLADPTFGPHVDEARIGAAGFSIGGYTVLELAGARTDQERFLKACRTDPTLHKCVVPEMKNMGDPEQMLAKVRSSSAESMARGGASYRDPRVRAVFAIAPAVGQAFDPDGFREVTIPVAMVVGAADPIAPVATNAGRFLASMPNAHLTVLPDGVAHYTFLDTCTDIGKDKLAVFCGDAAGVDREKVHATVSAMAVKFFDKNLE